MHKVKQDFQAVSALLTFAAIKTDVLKIFNAV